MTLTPAKAVDQAKMLLDFHTVERRQLDVIRRYQKGRQRLPAVIPLGSPREVKVMAAVSRVNVMPIVVNSLVQSMFVEGLRAPSGDLQKVWDVWQANRFDARQSAVHRSATVFGTGYVVVTPGDPVPVMRTVSPRSMMAMYGEDPDWPMWALERLGNGSWRLYDETAVYYLQGGDGRRWEWIETRHHDAGVGAPVVRFRDELDDDDEDEPESEAKAYPGQPDTITRGQVAPLIPLQDQIDLTTFALQLAQHYGAFKQKWAIGWAAANEVAAIKSAASTIMTFDRDPKGLQLGEFTQTDTKNFIEAREASLRHASALSQTPVHELTAQVIQMSAEALAAAEAGKDRKVGERQVLAGEGHEQVAELIGKYIGVDVPVGVEVRWRDTSARSFAATVDALGKLAQMLQIPVEELWERVPDVTEQDVARFKATAAAHRAAEPTAPGEKPASGLILPSV